MPALLLRTPEGHERAIPLARRITTVGRGPENDVALPDARLPATALHIHFDGRDFNAASHGGVDMLVNGRRKTTARLVDGDRIQLGSTELRFTMADAAPPARAAADKARLAAMQGLVHFSERLLSARATARVLDELLDAVLEAIQAEKGFVILLEDGRMVVKAARNLARETIEDALTRLSDSIVQRVVSSGQALVVADALHDTRWSSSSSVVNLRLCSVLCAPLLGPSGTLGVIYLGNDSVVNLFDEHDLEILAVFSAQASLLVQNALLLEGLRRENAALRHEVDQTRFGELVGAGAAMREVYRRIERVAATDVPVLVQGDPGTGKELVAREIHRRSGRAPGPFVVASCGGVPEDVLEAELVGQVRGAFPGAVAGRDGKLQMAAGGTLFLDEVGDLPPVLQAKLVRALQERTTVRAGDTRAEPVDFRLVAATSRPLEQELQRGRLREDLFHRLNVVGITLPLLRDRGEDVVVLARFLLQRYAREFGAPARSFTPAAIAALRQYAWPGNVRELENRLKKAVVLCDGAEVGPEDLELGPDALAPVLPLAQAKEEFQKRYIHEVLERNGGNRTKTAKDLGVDPRTIFRHLEKLEAEQHDAEPERLPPERAQEPRS